MKKENICANCIHFNQPHPIKNLHELGLNKDSWGSCVQVRSTKFNDAIFVMGNTVCVVGKNFGCVHFKDK